MDDEQFFEQAIKEKFGDNISDETREKLKLLYDSIGKAVKKTVDDMTLDLMKKHNLSLGEARIIVVKQMGKLVKR